MSAECSLSKTKRDWGADATRFAKALTPQLKDELARQLGLPASALDILPNLGYTEHGIQDRDGRWMSAWTAPMTDARGSVIGIMKRFAEPLSAEGVVEQSYERSAKGSKAGLLIPDGWRGKPGPVLLVTGLPNVIAVSMCGLPCIGLPSSFSGAEMLAQLLADIPAKRQIIVLGANDAESDGGRPSRERAARLAEALSEGLHRPVRLSFPPDGLKDAYAWVLDSSAGFAEAEDWLTVGVQLASHVLASSEGPGSPLQVLHFADVAPVLDVADFVEDLLLEGGMSVMFGETNCGKSFLALDLSLHVAIGESWHGREVDRGGVIYLALEGAHGIRNRVAAFKKANNLEGVDLPFTIVPVGINLLDAAVDVSRVIDAVKAQAERMPGLDRGAGASGGPRSVPADDRAVRSLD